VAEAIELTATGAAEDKRRAFAETRLMSRGAKAVQGARPLRSLAAQCGRRARWLP